MSDDTITYTPVEENPWYKLAIMRSESEPSNYFFWNGYMRHLMESEGKSAEADKVRVRNIPDGGKGGYKEVSLPKLTPDELKKVQAINGLPGKLDPISFEGCSFDSGVDFESFYFPTVVSFKNANFEGYTNFWHASFGNKADFSGVRFQSLTIFTGASFKSEADFSDASFANLIGFTGTKFGGKADFKNASFEGRSFFDKAKFGGRADFSASSDTPPHKGAVSFASATFKQAPAFFERQLHEDTDWHDVKWPEPSSKEQASIYVRRYECLSLMMSKLEKYDDMHTFFRSSMQAKEIRDGWSVASVMSRLYGTLFDYGWGVGRAFGLWLVNILVGFVLICINGNQQSIDVEQSLVLSFSNAHSFIGLHSGAQANLYDAASDIPWFNVIWGTQTVVGLFLLFFFLLTIRNRFRMR